MGSTFGPKHIIFLMVLGHKAPLLQKYYDFAFLFRRGSKRKQFFVCSREKHQTQGENVFAPEKRQDRPANARVENGRKMTPNMGSTQVLCHKVRLGDRLSLNLIYGYRQFPHLFLNKLGKSLTMPDAGGEGSASIHA